MFDLIVITNAWIHLMAAVLVVGGSFSLNLIVTKKLGALPSAEAGKLSQAVGKAFGSLAWIMMALILLTGLTRMIGLKLFSSYALLETTYGNLLLAKIVLFAIIIINSVLIAGTGMKLEKLGADGPPPADQLTAGQARIKTLGMTNLILGAIVVAFAVTMRVIGAP
ncbi:MAG TPA: hypothetical protein ENI11_03790 [Actinobacteria bacterium]|nr:hypothetical protein [Actinomycetota bacterium]